MTSGLAWLVVGSSVVGRLRLPRCARNDIRGVLAVLGVVGFLRYDGATDRAPLNERSGFSGKNDSGMGVPVWGGLQ